MTKLYRMKPLEWVPCNLSGDRLLGPGGFSIQDIVCDGESCLVVDPSGFVAESFDSLSAAKAYAEKLALEEALRWVEEVTPQVTPEAPRWIPVGERMPEEKDADSESATCLCFQSLCRECSAGRIFTAYTHRGVWWDHRGPIESNTEITHWMSFPQPPKEGA